MKSTDRALERFKQQHNEELKRLKQICFGVNNSSNKENVHASNRRQPFKSKHCQLHVSLIIPRSVFIDGLAQPHRFETQ